MKPPKHIMLYGGILFLIVDPFLRYSMNDLADHSAHHTHPSHLYALLVLLSWAFVGLLAFMLRGTAYARKKQDHATPKARARSHQKKPGYWHILYAAPLLAWMLDRLFSNMAAHYRLQHPIAGYTYSFDIFVNNLWLVALLASLLLVGLFTLLIKRITTPVPTQTSER
jgi:hypothetical protein